MVEITSKLNLGNDYPSDWKQLLVGDLVSITTGSRNTQDNNPEAPFPFFVRSQKIERIYGYSFDKEAVLTAGDGGAGKIFHYINGKFDAHQRVYVLSDFVDELHGKYFYWQFSNLFYDRIMSMTAKSTVDSVRQEMISRMSFPLPCLKEQQAIAEALNDADALIASLERLIEKKQKIFNSLLSALIEIDDNGNATFASLNSGFQIKARIGWQGLTTKEYLENGNYLLVTGTEISDGNVNWEDCWRVEKERFDQDKNIQLKDNDVLITKDGTIGKVAQVNGLKMPATLNSGVFVIRPTTTEVLPRYLYYVFRSNLFKSFLNELSAGSTINHLYQKDIVKFKFLMPNSIARQQHIVRVLDEVKLEISLLSQQLDKAKKVKAGMIQELLTGKTRLI